MDFQLMTSRFEEQALGSVASPGILPPAHSATPFAAHLDKAMESGRRESSKPEPKGTQHSHSRKEVRPSPKPAAAAPGGTVQVPAAPVVADPQASPDPQALSLDPFRGATDGTAPADPANSTALAAQAQPSKPQPPVQPTRSQQNQNPPASNAQQPIPSSLPSAKQAQPSQPAAAKDASASNQAPQPGADAAKADAQAQAARLVAAAEAVAFKLPPVAPEAAPKQAKPASSQDSAANLQRQGTDNHLPETSRQAAKADSNPASSKQNPTGQLTTPPMTASEDALAVNPPQAPGASNVAEAVLGKAQPTTGGTAGPAILSSPSAPVQAPMPSAQPTNTSGGQTDSDASSRDGNARVSSPDSTGARIQPPINSESFSLHDLAPSAAASPSTQAAGSVSNKTAAPLPSASSPAQEQALAAWQNVNSQIGRIVNAAALYQAAGGVEMRLQLRTEALGPVEIRAALNGDKLGAAIGVQNPEAHATLTNQLPALQQSLVNHNVQVEHLSVFNGAAGGNMNSGSGSGQHAEHFAPAASRLAPSGRDGISAVSPRAEVLSLENSSRRLSVRA